MPIYEYQCQACEVTLEKIQKMNDAPLVTCPECNQDALKKLISAPVFRLKGQGWYETDFKSGDKKKNLHESTTADTKSSTSDAASSSSNGASEKGGSDKGSSGKGDSGKGSSDTKSSSSSQGPKGGKDSQAKKIPQPNLNR